MRNIKLEIEYEGTNYQGWQAQKSLQPTVHSPQKKSIQQTIENVLRQLLQEKIKLICSGRTDAGVHANSQVANFKTHSKIVLSRLHEGLNALLPEDISITKVKAVSDDFHSRFSAKSKIYRYTIFNGKHRSAILRNYAYFLRYPLDVALMRKEAKVLLGRHDFSAFCGSCGKHKNPWKTVKDINITRKGDFLYIDIEADGFLYNMVRNIAGTLIEIGRGRFPKESLKKILLYKDRKLAGPTAPAKGLTLMKVVY